jgi:polyisoprenoid-binding protein YceI
MKLLATLLILSLAAGAAPTAVFAAAAPQWAVQKAASSVRFTSSMNGQAFSGGFRRWDADIRFDPKNLAGSSVKARFDTASAVTGDPDRDQALPTEAFLSAAKFPVASYEASSFHDLGGGRFEALGRLTLRGISKPLTLPFTLAISGADARMKASVAINRLAFGVGQNEWKVVTTLPAPVRVDIQIVARRIP